MSTRLALLRPVPPPLSGPKSPFGPRAFVPFALLCALFALSGCGTVIDRVKLQDTVQASLEDSIHEKIKKVECPSDQPVEPGATFSCDVIFSDHRREEAILKIRNEEADITMVSLKPKN
ncbi:MAG TPA: DUF4333 domain-containing protein [Solirubrobacterales bacterium]|nr:DUF4333 domain-containing protein [Solirubrobacterales bacterium]